MHAATRPLRCERLTGPKPLRFDSLGDYGDVRTDADVAPGSGFGLIENIAGVLKDLEFSPQS